MRFTGKNVVVTGSSSGIGFAAASVFLEQGASVLLMSRDSTELSKAQSTLDQKFPGKVHAISGDVSSESDWAATTSFALSKFSVIDVLVNNAGIGFRGTVLETDVATWDKLFSINVRGVFLGCKSVLPHMISRGSGSIVNVSSVAGHEIAMASRAAYVSTKAAVNGLTKSLAIDHSAQGIRINAVAPGTTDSPYFQKFSPDMGNLEDYRKMLSNRQVMQRMADPREIGLAIAWLASDEASFCAGTILDVDGGWSVW
jgi:NAD(P)-dependent dehydrogenase (short-subunit alcohol dehydrogenase family)